MNKAVNDQFIVWRDRAEAAEATVARIMIDWQPGATAPMDTSYFAVETVLGDIQAWTYNQEKRWFEILHVPGGGRTIAYTNSTIKRWARWNQVFDLIRGCAVTNGER